eukprot:9079923-Pyramimonas_sp.AAC.1
MPVRLMRRRCRRSACTTESGWQLVGGTGRLCRPSVISEMPAHVLEGGAVSPVEAPPGARVGGP